ncbi:TniQ family protein [Kitasatospora sp. NBC_00070]|uniref:TniQ family protein n=1 Tax=Kitasatospora sp. NBC_00070 TaxID=2975962 RepID=UPI003253E7FD
MTWSPDRMPIFVPPIPGEALDSWIEAYAFRLRINASGLLSFLNLNRSQTRRMVVALTEHELGALSRATGVAPADLTRMTLSPQDGISIAIRPQTRGLARSPTWRGTSGSRYCPSCLHETGDRWQLRWRLPWSFACRQHSLLLLDTCPACEARPLPASRHGHAPSLGRIQCTHPLGDSPAVSVPGGGAVIAAQARIDEILDAGDPESARGTLHDLYTLAWKALAVLHSNRMELPDLLGDALRELDRAPILLLHGLGSEDAATAATGTVIALAAYDDQTPGSSVVLNWITQGDRQRFVTATPSNVLRTYRRLSPPLMSRVLASLDPGLQPHHRLRYGTATSNPAIPKASRADLRRRATMIPKLMWPSWTIRLADSTAPNYQPYPQRWTLSSLLLVARAPVSFAHPHACAMLGIPTSKRAVQMLLGPQDEGHNAVVSAVAQLAAGLDSEGSPINYERRRALFGGPDAAVRLDSELHRDLCKRQGWRPPGARHLRLLDLYLRSLLTGSDLTSLAGRRMDSPTVCTGWNVLRFRMDPAIRQLIVRQAQAALDDQGITNEPIFWEPPVEWVTGVTSWPGQDSDGLDEVLRRIEGADASLAEVAAATGLSFENVRLYCDATGTTFPELPRQDRRPNDPTPRVGDLGADRLRELYVEQQLSIAKIAKLIGTSTSVVRGELTRTGVTLHQQGRRREHFIDRKWFEHEYLGRRRTLVELAAECGASHSTLARAAAGWGIPLRPRGAQPRLKVQNQPEP